MLESDGMQNVISIVSYFDCLVCNPYITKSLPGTCLTLIPVNLMPLPEDRVFWMLSTLS